MIDVKIAKKLILSEIGALAAADGFQPKLAEQAFYRTEPFGRRIIHVGFVPHQKTDIDITVDVAIRIDAVETLVNDRRNDLTVHESERTATLGGDIGNLNEGRQRRWKIVSSEEVGSVATSIYSDVRSIGGEFFERFSNMDNVLRVLASSDPRDWWLSPGHAARCKRAVALAFALGESDEMEAVARTCEKLLRQKDNSALPELSEFLKCLQTRTDKGELRKLR